MQNLIQHICYYLWGGTVLYLILYYITFCTIFCAIYTSRLLLKLIYNGDLNRDKYKRFGIKT